MEKCPKCGWAHTNECVPGFHPAKTPMAGGFSLDKFMPGLLPEDADAFAKALESADYTTTPYFKPLEPVVKRAFEIAKLKARVAELEKAIEAILRARPSALECNDFAHAPKDRHEGFDCPCKARWDTAIEAACNLLKH